MDHKDPLDFNRTDVFNGLHDLMKRAAPEDLLLLQAIEIQLARAWKLEPEPTVSTPKFAVINGGKG